MNDRCHPFGRWWLFKNRFRWYLWTRPKKAILCGWREHNPVPLSDDIYKTIEGLFTCSRCGFYLDHSGCEVYLATPMLDCGT